MLDLEAIKADCAMMPDLEAYEYINRWFLAPDLIARGSSLSSGGHMRKAVAEFFANAKPRQLALVAEVERLRAEIEDLRAALEQYANHDNWQSFDQFMGECIFGWEIAEEALGKVPPQSGATWTIS